MSIANGQDQRDGNNQSRRLGVIEEESRRIGDKQNEIIDFDSTRSDTDEQSRIGRRRKVVGGMLSQLMQDAEAQLAYSKSQLSYHEKQISSLEKKIENIKNMKAVFFEE